MGGNDQTTASSPSNTYKRFHSKSRRRIKYLFYIKSKSMRMESLAEFTKKLKLEIGIASIFIVLTFLFSLYYFDVPRRVVFKLTGKEIEVGEDFRHLVDLSVEDFSNSIMLFSVDPDNSKHILIKNDTYNINKTIVVPAGTHLTIEAGSVLIFNNGASLISYSPITAMGTEREPILFVAQNKESPWGVVGLVKADKSVFDHVKFENGNTAVVNHQKFSGSLSLVESDAEITNSEFLNASGNDGVWVLRGDVTIRGNIFKDNRVDCLDLDFGSGEISNNEFINCGDEGIDLMENQNLEVFNNLIVSAGSNGIDADNNLEEILELNSIK